jgi:TetR/AcrR family transcriptional repressor of nem operon
MLVVNHGFSRLLGEIPVDGRRRRRPGSNFVIAVTAASWSSAPDSLRSPGGVIYRTVQKITVMDRFVNKGYYESVARPREFDENKVLRAARQQFWSTGYAGTTMDAIAAVTGLGKGSLYGAFGDKRQLFLRVFDAYCTEIVNTIGQKLSGPDDQAFERLCTHIRAMAARTAADTVHRGCLLAKGTAELSEHDTDLAARSLRTFKILQEALAVDIEAAQRHGDIDPAADPRQLADLVLAVLRGIEALGKAGTGEATLRAIAETAIAVLPRPTDAATRTSRPRRHAHQP